MKRKIGKKKTCAVIVIIIALLLISPSVSTYLYTAGQRFLGWQADDTTGGDSNNNYTAGGYIYNVLPTVVNCTSNIDAFDNDVAHTEKWLGNVSDNNTVADIQVVCLQINKPAPLPPAVLTWNRSIDGNPPTNEPPDPTDDVVVWREPGDTAQQAILHYKALYTYVAGTPYGTYEIDVHVSDENYSEEGKGVIDDTTISTTLPIADAGPDQPSPGEVIWVGENVTFDGSNSYDPDNCPPGSPIPGAGIVRYTWEFGDGETYTETSTSAPDGAFDGITTHAYDEEGPYEDPQTKRRYYIMNLTVEDDEGATDVDSANIYVSGKRDFKIVKFQIQNMGVPGKVGYGTTSTVTITILNNGTIDSFAVVQLWVWNPENPNTGDKGHWDLYFCTIVSTEHGPSAGGPIKVGKRVMVRFDVTFDILGNWTFTARVDPCPQEDSAHVYPDYDPTNNEQTKEMEAVKRGG